MTADKYLTAISKMTDNGDKVGTKHAQPCSCVTLAPPYELVGPAILDLHIHLSEKAISLCTVWADQLYACVFQVEVRLEEQLHDFRHDRGNTTVDRLQAMRRLCKKWGTSKSIA